MSQKLAIHGGNPIRRTFLPYGHQWVSEEDVEAVVRVLRSDWVTQGPVIEEFERGIADYCGVKHAVAVSSGTAALHAACAAAGLGPSHEAITTPLTFVATANAIHYRGARPMLADIQEDTFNIDPCEVEKRISSRTKAILPVDFAGQPHNVDEISAIAQKWGLTIIEDAAHALGSLYKGKKIGSLADMTILSFHPVKHITTGEGGIVLTNSDSFYGKLKIFRHHGITKKSEEVNSQGSWYYDIHDPGYNLRITDFQCALGLSQLKRLDQLIQRRHDIAARYIYAFKDVTEVITPFEEEWAKSNYHIYVIKLQLEKLRAGRREIFEALRSENIGVQVHYVPVHLFSFYRETFGYRRGDYPKAEAYYERAITLPLFPKMSDQDVDDVVAAVRKVIEHYRL